jgi:hypothetical protein
MPLSKPCRWFGVDIGPDRPEHEDVQANKRFNDCDGALWLCLWAVPPGTLFRRNLVAPPEVKTRPDYADFAVAVR